MIPHEAVVGAFNELGYSASFAAVATRLRATGADAGVQANTLYLRYPSREALGEMWLLAQIPTPDLTARLYGAFSKFMLAILGSLESQRDFSRAWVAALKLAGPLHLPQLSEFHDTAGCYFRSWLDANEAQISLPTNVRYADVRCELSDALCGLAAWLIGYWEIDRSAYYGRTRRMVDNVGYLLDALLIRRADFGEAGLLWHLHALYDEQREQFLKPLLDILVKPERAGRLADPLSLLELLRTNRPLPAQRR